MTDWLSPSRGRSRTALASAAFLLLCAACTAVPMPPSAPMPGASSTAPRTPVSEPRQIQLGATVRGTLAADGDADDYPLQMEPGQAFTAILETPAQGQETYLQVHVFRQHPVTGELLFETSAIVGSEEGEAGATKVTSPEEAGTFVVRVQGMDLRYGGSYVLRVLPTAKGEISLGQAIQGELDGRGDSDDYVLSVAPRTRFNARLVVPYTGKSRSLQVFVYRKDAVTGALESGGSTIVDAESGRPGATRPVEALEGGTYVLRVRGIESRYGGRYTLSAERL